MFERCGVAEEQVCSSFQPYRAVLSFAPGEHVIHKGEEASFCGVILDGGLDVFVSDTLTVSLSKGDLIGEMSYFEGSAFFRHDCCVVL